MNKISKVAYNFAPIFLFAVTAVTNVIFGINLQKETNSEQILQEKLDQLNEEEKKENNSLLLKPFFGGLQPHHLVKDFTITSGTCYTAVRILSALLPKPYSQFQDLQLLGFTLCEAPFFAYIVHRKHHREALNQKIKNLEEIRKEMKKNSQIDK